MEELLKDTGIPKEWWDLCKLDSNNQLILPTPKELFDAGLIEENDRTYQEWLYYQDNPPTTTLDKTAVLESKVKELEQQLAMSTVESTMAMAQMQENSNNAVAELTMAMAMLGTGGAANV